MKRGVLTRRIPAVELLGAATVLCSDKTGTLTQNKMRIAELWSPDGTHAVGGAGLPESVHEVVEFGGLNASMHMVDEHIRVADLEPLSKIYERTLERLLHHPAGP